MTRRNYQSYESKRSLYTIVTGFMGRLTGISDTPKRLELVNGTYPSLLYHRHPRVCRLVCEYILRLPIHSVIGMVEEIVADNNKIHISRIHPMVMARMVERIVHESTEDIHFSLFQSLGHVSDDYVMVV